jgi:glycosyltransferase involved in cell wall biosynthesis
MERQIGLDGRKIRVLDVIARLNLGGSAHHVSLLSGRLGHEYETLLVAGRVPKHEASAGFLAERHGARLETLSALGPEIRPHSDARALAELVQVVRRFQPDIVHTHTAKAGFLGRLAARVAARPRPAIVHTYHGHVLEQYFGRFQSRVYRRLERQAGVLSDVLIGVSQATVDDLVRLGIAARSKFRVIPYGLELAPFTSVDEEARCAIRAEAGVQPGEVLVTFVGRLAAVKRPELAVQAIAQARQRGAPVRLAIVGHGELHPGLQGLADELGVRDIVRFLGWRSDTTAIAAATDVAILTSANEGTPVWLIEAAAAGKPGIATNVGGVADVVVDGAGFRVGSDDEEALVEGLCRLAADAELRRSLGTRAQAHVLKTFSIERLLSDVRSLYRELLAGRAERESARCGISGFVGPAERTASTDR